MFTLRHKFFIEGALGMGCSDLGLSMSNSSTSEPPALNDNSKNGGKVITVSKSAFVFLIFALMKDKHKS